MADGDSIFSTLPPCSFDGITMPLIELTVYIGNTLAFHSYPYRAGMDIEYIGREPISGTGVAKFFTGMQTSVSSNVLWPGTLTKLISRVQEQRSGPLVLPTVGTLPKAAIKLTGRYTSTEIDGATVQFQFWEDSTDDFALASPINVPASLDAAASVADKSISNVGVPLPDLGNDSDGNPLTTFRDSVNEIRSLLMTYQQDLAIATAQINACLDAVSSLLDDANAFSSTDDWSTRDALFTIADGVSQLLAQFKSTKPIVHYTTPIATSLVGLAAATNNQVSDLLQLNEFADPNDIAAGEVITAYAA